jgi:plasmid stabilization system protein ParE
LRFTPQAREQFLSLLVFIAAQDARAAAALVARVDRVLRRLVRFPDSGRRISEFPLASTREVLIPPYRFFYETEGDEVWVSAVWRSAQRPEAPE